MGFSLFEISSWLGRPVCLYEFQWGETFYRYTSADRVVEHGDDDLGNPVEWEPISISDNGFTQGVTQQDFTITLPRSNPVVQLFRSTPPSRTISIVCRRFHKDDVDQESTVYWSGSIGNVRPKDAVSAEIIGIPLTTTLRRSGMRLCWERGCPHALYDEGCRVDRELFKTVTTITAMTGASIEVASLGAWPAAQYAGGYVEWEATAEGTKDNRAIEGSGGGLVLNLMGTTDRMEVGQDITLYLGCDLTAATCQGVFNNLANHGGFEFLAGKSPFDGNPVF